MPKLSRVDFESWLCTNPLQRLESLIIFKVFASSYHTIDSFTQGQSQYTSCHIQSCPGQQIGQNEANANARLFCSCSSSFPLQISLCTKLSLVRVQVGLSWGQMENIRAGGGLNCGGARVKGGGAKL